MTAPPKPTQVMLRLVLAALAIFWWIWLCLIIHRVFNVQKPISLYQVLILAIMLTANHCLLRLLGEKL